jgi:hypothetical protein
VSEQRIGRIDRLGQKFLNIRIVNLHYAATIETDVYQALRTRIGLFETVVGRLQPILAKLPTLISDRVLHGRTKPAEARQVMVDEIEADADRIRATGFDIDEVTDADLAEPQHPPSPLTMEDLERVISHAALLPPGIEVTPMGKREYRFRQPSLGREVRVSTDPNYYGSAGRSQAASVVCHTINNAPLHLVPLSPGSAAWNEEQSRRNFQLVQKVVVPGYEDSRLIKHPLAEEAGGDPHHGGGQQFLSKDAPDWQTLNAFVLGAKLK